MGHYTLQARPWKHPSQTTGGVSTNIISSWPSHKKLFSPASISVCCGKAITAEQAKNMSDKKLAEVLTDTLRQMQTKSRIKHGKKNTMTID